MKTNEVLTLENQQEKIGSLLLHGYRFVTMTVVDKGEEFDIFYHFDLDYEMVNYQLVLKKGEVLPSISDIFTSVTALRYCWAHTSIQLIQPCADSASSSGSILGRLSIPQALPQLQ